MKVPAKHSGVSAVVPEGNWTLTHLSPVTWKLLCFTFIETLLWFCLFWLNPGSNRSSNSTKTAEQQ